MYLICYYACAFVALRCMKRNLSWMVYKGENCKVEVDWQLGVKMTASEKLAIEARQQSSDCGQAYYFSQSIIGWT